MERILEHMDMDWDKLFNSMDVWRHKDYIFLETLFDFKKFEGTLLDVGCGLGDGVLYLSDKCSSVSKFYGADISDVGINKCLNNLKLNHIDFFVHDISNELKIKFDVIICLQTIEHLVDPTKAVNNLIDSTNKLLIIAAPYKNRRYDRDHRWSFDENDFSDLMDSYKLDQSEKNIYWVYTPKKG